MRYSDPKEHTLTCHVNVVVCHMSCLVVSLFCAHAYGKEGRSARREKLGTAPASFVLETELRFTVGIFTLFFQRRSARLLFSSGSMKAGPCLTRLRPGLHGRSLRVRCGDAITVMLRHVTSRQIISNHASRQSRSVLSRHVISCHSGLNKLQRATELRFACARPSLHQVVGGSGVSLHSLVVRRLVVHSSRYRRTFSFWCGNLKGWFHLSVCKPVHEFSRCPRKRP